MNVLVLGHKGMLGHMVYNVFNQNSNYNTLTISERFPNWNENLFDNVDFVINCIGAIPQKTDNFDINWEIPIWLNENTKCKIIHPSTDCEFDVSNYCLSKKRATDYIKNYGKLTKIIQTSIIGTELNSNASLLEWFLSQKGEVNGYTGAIWNGITTLEWAKQCKNFIDSWEIQPILTIFYSDNVSKFKLLSIIQECYKKTDVVIIPKKLGKDKSLKGTVKTKEIKEQILELIKFNNV